MDFFQVAQVMAMVFLVVVVGYVANKRGIMDAALNRRLSTLVLTITTPSLILSAALDNTNLPAPGELLLLLAIAFFCYVIFIAAAFLLSWLLRVPRAQAGVFRFMVIFANVGFIGYPLTISLFGREALFYAVLFNLPFNLLSYSLGVALISGGRGRRLSLRTLFSPCVVAALLSVLFALTGLSAPTLLVDTLSLLGDITAPAALLIVGSSLAELPLRRVLGGPRIYAMAAVRLLLLPTLLFFLLRPVVSDPTVLRIAVILAGMPVAANCTMLCLEYGGDQQLAAQGTFLTTLLSVVTIPLLAAAFL